MSPQCHCPEKAYKNLDFLTSPEARVVRMLAEYLEPLTRFEEEQIEDTVVFFGSARLRSSEDVQKDIQRESRGKRTPAKTRRLRQFMEQLNMARYYDDAMELARMLAAWSEAIPDPKRRSAICSGGPNSSSTATCSASVNSIERPVRSSSASINSERSSCSTSARVRSGNRRPT